MENSILYITCTSQGSIGNSVSKLVWYMSDSLSEMILNKYQIGQPNTYIMTRKLMDTLAVPIADNQNTVVNYGVLHRDGFDIYSDLNKAITQSKYTPIIVGGNTLYMQLIGISKYIFLHYDDTIPLNERVNIDIAKIFGLYRMNEKLSVKVKHTKNKLDVYVLEKQ